MADSVDSMTLRPAWPLMKALAGAAAQPTVRRELRAWSILAVGSLAVAGVFALLLAISRVPGIDSVPLWPLKFFHKGLVIHVIMAFVIWFLAVFGLMAALAAGRLSNGATPLGGLGTVAWAATAAAFFCLAIPALLDRGEPSLSNYVPVIIDPLYYLGLVLVFGGVGLAALRLLIVAVRPHRPIDGFAFGVIAAALVYLVAMVCFGFALHFLAGQPPSHAFNSNLFWGGGHALQFVNVTLFSVAWYLLGGLAFGAPLIREGTLRSAAAVPVLVVLVMPILYLALPPFDPKQDAIFTDLQYALAVSPLIVGLATLGALRRHGRPMPWRDPAFLCFVLSAAIFALGGFEGIFVNGTDTRTPAHYHGVIAAVSLAFMGLFIRLILPLLGRRLTRPRATRALIWLFGVGQGIACIGLFWAGGYGAPRKTAGSAQGLDTLGAKIGMSMNGVGALIAVIGGVMFIWLVASALLRKRPANPASVENNS